MCNMCIIHKQIHTHTCKWLDFELLTKYIDISRAFAADVKNSNQKQHKVTNNKNLKANNNKKQNNLINLLEVD